MFDSIKSVPEPDKDTYDTIIEALRIDLVMMQQRLRASSCSFPVMIVFGGVDGAGKHETVDFLNEWLDPRWLETHAYAARNEAERSRPEYWRFWRDLPRHGEIAFYLSAWCSKPLLDNVKHDTSKKEFKQELKRIQKFERTQVDNGTLVLKFWMHLDKKSQLKRLEKLSQDELTAWQVKAVDWEHAGMYEEFTESAEYLIEQTNDVPWMLIDGGGERARSLQVARTLIKQVNRKLDVLERQKPKNPIRIRPFGSGDDIIGQLEMPEGMKKKKYEQRLAEQQARLHKLSQKAYKNKRSIIIVFEGSDAAGKGGCIRRITKGLDARQYDVSAISAPTKEEIEHHYLWRFWNELPEDGRIMIFDRSWYGRVLVERIEHFATDAQWKQAFNEINEFEAELHRHGVILIKFWLQVTRDEQLRRFQDREKVKYKKWKLTDEDWRNRERWDDYQVATNDMIDLCNTDIAPWDVIPANSKRHARIEVLDTLCDRLKDAL